MAKRESQLPFSFNNDQDVKRVRDQIRGASFKDLQLAASVIDQELNRRIQEQRSWAGKASDMKDALAGFLDKISFDYFCTFTTRKPVSLYATRRIAEKVCARVEAGTASSVFWAAEEFDVRDGFHFHALMKMPELDQMKNKNSTGQVTYLDSSSKFLKMDLFDWYFKKYGRCQIIDNREPDRQVAASYYISKYVTKKITDYDFQIAKSHMR